MGWFAPSRAVRSVTSTHRLPQTAPGFWKVLKWAEASARACGFTPQFIGSRFRNGPACLPARRCSFGSGSLFRKSGTIQGHRHRSSPLSGSVSTTNKTTPATAPRNIHRASSWLCSSSKKSILLGSYHARTASLKSMACFFMLARFLFSSHINLTMFSCL